MSLAPSPSRPVTFSLNWRRVTAPLLIAAAICPAVIWHGADRRPVDATQPLELRDASRAGAAVEGPVLRIGTFNIHGGRGPGGTLDLDATADVLRRQALDFVGLYEVHGSFTTDQAEGLGSRLEMASLFAGTERRWWHEHFGNGLLTRRPLRSVMRIDLPGTQGKRFRNALLATLDVGGTTVKVIATHIDTATDRDEQLEIVFELFRSLEPPVVLMGDLNCRTDHPLLSGLLAEPGVVDAVAAHAGSGTPALWIDHLIVRGMEIRDSRVVTTDASDHPCVWAELAVSGDSREW